MVYDAKAKRVAIKAIAKVESNMKYDAVNFADPITVGVMQWFGTRAAAILGRIRTENPSSWVGVGSEINSALDANPATSSFWNTYYLKKNDGESLRPVLLANVAIQDDQAVDDLENYVNVATSNGMDKDGNTQAVLFFMVMYHQSPRQALRVLSSAGPSSTITRLYAICLNNSVLGQYRTRYKTAYDIIIADDDSGVGSASDPTEDTPGGDDGTGTSRTLGDLAYISRSGDQLIAHMRSGQRVFLRPVSSDRWVSALDAESGADVPDPPSTPAPGTDEAKRSGLLAWMEARVDAYAYRQAPGRLSPATSGFTDCSGLVHTAYKDVCGIEVGTWTGDQHFRGRHVASGSGVPDVSSWKVGDLLFIDWKGGGIDHVEMYAGDGKVWGHGGPDPGPDLQNVADMLSHAYSWKVRRHLS